MYQIAVLQNGAKEIDSGADLYAYDEDGALSRRWTGRELLWGLGLVGIGFFLHGLFNTLWRIYLPDIEWLYPIVAGGLALLAFMVLRTRFSFDLFSQVEVGGEQSREFTKRRASDLWQLLKQEHPAFFRRSVLLSSLAILPFLIYIGIGSFLMVNAASQLAIDLRILTFPFIFLALPIASIPYIYTQFLLLLAYIQLSQHYPPNASTLRQQI